MNIADQQAAVGVEPQGKPDFVEYAIRSKNNFIVTRYSHGLDGGSSEVIGEFENSANAERVASGMALAEQAEGVDNVLIYRPYLDLTSSIGRSA